MRILIASSALRPLECGEFSPLSLTANTTRTGPPRPVEGGSGRRGWNRAIAVSGESVLHRGKPGGGIAPARGGQACMSVKCY